MQSGRDGEKKRGGSRKLALDDGRAIELTKAAGSKKKKKKRTQPP